MGYDSWHPAGCLFDVYGLWVVYDAGSKLEARLSSMIHERDWFWPPARSENLVAIQRLLPEVAIGDADKPVWNSKEGCYSCADTWESIRFKLPKVVWWKLIWFSLAVPQHAFML